ncbi:MAG: fatty acid desaturase [Pseudomonadota bacterium]
MTDPTMAQTNAVGVVSDDLRTAVRAAVARRSDWHGLLWFARHLALAAAAATGVVASDNPVWLATTLWLLGLTLVTLFAPLHECIHSTAFKHRGLNRVVAAICGTVLLISPTWFRAFHFNHHRYTQDPDRDPELMRAKPRTRWQYVRHLSGLPTWYAAISTLLRLAVRRERPPWLTRRELHQASIEARAGLALYVGLAAFAPSVFLAWAAALLLGEPLRRAWLMAEHTGCALAPDMWRNTRTVTSLPLLRMLTWQMGYHNVHHAWPGVPFHALPAIDALVAERTVERESGYIVTHQALYDALADRAANASLQDS